jgi:hypothetical protein
MYINVDASQMQTRISTEGDYTIYNISFKTYKVARLILSC